MCTTTTTSLSTAWKFVTSCLRLSNVGLDRFHPRVLPADIHERYYFEVELTSGKMCPFIGWVRMIAFTIAFVRVWVCFDVIKLAKCVVGVWLYSCVVFSVRVSYQRHGASVYRLSKCKRLVCVFCLYVCGCVRVSCDCMIGCFECVCCSLIHCNSTIAWTIDSGTVPMAWPKGSRPFRIIWLGFF